MLSRNPEEEEFEEADRLLDSINFPTFDRQTLVRDRPTTSSPVMYNSHVILMNKFAFELEGNPKELVIASQFVNGADNSGGKIWEASTLLAEWIISDGPTLFANRSVLELGAGVSGLPGLSASIFAESVSLTDGQDSMVEYLSLNLDLNKEILRQTRCLVEGITSELTVNCFNLNWDHVTSQQQEKYAKHFDIIIASEIIYDAVNTDSMASAFDTLLKEDGTAFIILPARSRSTHNESEFLTQLAVLGFSMQAQEIFDIKQVEQSTEVNLQQDTKQSCEDGVEDERYVLYSCQREKNW
uniref:Calmodulin-lysine N-methyltransferase n=1 Tax=Fibrocapsa japonica TaxID=94617 RepID=A0A7S2UVU6_9STRA|mmetsp:Transcript_15976/g.23508  ORF Transcript_15976/g.23508 Transcript_15976/m.23508 type:complete len:298 (+) Transcript_15976:49-942(+)|eukprot:CAMPEP_0113949664 /NCGR_PEP_ID=MMETSP1339-20121228/76800_1 /TAXON_ID=94617 /ORGANISM="Fibrocapsa japonica" /LENGTH=297 /DNA_ID=CAMNT_0000957191 /DNA_START=30 /DNA_END=923 /DNA_ORIENTATION=- /assembly_acc=CAM_ASM_000762